MYPRFATACTLAVVCVGSVAIAHEPIRVTYTTSDGVEIVGDYWTPIDMKKPAPAVILLHMYTSQRTAWHPQVVALEYAGFAIMSIDLRGHGDSTGPAAMNLTQRVLDRDATLFNAMNLDVAGAYDWLAKRKEVDLSRIVIIGASVGCSVALDYARRDKSVDAVALLSPGTNYLGVDSLAHIKEYGRRPMLMLTSEEERSRGCDSLHEAAKDAGASVEFAALPNTEIHGTKMYGKVARVDKRIAAFLKKHVGPAGSDKVYASLSGHLFYPEGDPRIDDLSPQTVRIFSSAAEAVSRGLKDAGSP